MTWVGGALAVWLMATPVLLPVLGRLIEVDQARLPEVPGAPELTRGALRSVPDLPV